ncbi:hypothetical protein [Streptomyces sp. MNU103]|uniref:hypothetical protein n=1 Tax=Streptomyces sp. MNU103 TaxID=2560024 RepID=UPI001E57C7DF|nr:hypothetical protein [Streptomyces sp. MNU103]
MTSRAWPAYTAEEYRPDVTACARSSYPRGSTLAVTSGPEHAAPAGTSSAFHHGPA